MTREELLAGLRALLDHGDTEARHVEADELLLTFIADDEVTAAFEDLPKWYA